MTDITYDYIWQVYQKEKQTNELSAIPKTFYVDAEIFIKNIKEEESENIITNTQKIANLIFEKRKQKIMIYIALNKNIPQITPEETEFYKNAVELYNNSKLPYHSTEPSRPQLVATKDIPEILLPSGKRIGPIAKEQVIKLENTKDIDFLLNMSLCVYT